MTSKPKAYIVVGDYAYFLEGEDVVEIEANSTNWAEGGCVVPWNPMTLRLFTLLTIMKEEKL